MKTQRNIFIAFILNLLFSIFELIGGMFTGSVAILSDAIHDVGDAMTIGISYFLERLSKKKPDSKYTYGYSRYSVVGGFITTMVLIVSSALMIYNAILRIYSPTRIHYDGMILFAIIGVIVNFCAAFLTREGVSINQKAVNLHMLEDVFGWITVLIGAIVMRFTDISVIDPIMSIGVSIFILINAFKNLKEVMNLFLEKTPDHIDVDHIMQNIYSIQGVLDVHHIHIRSMDGQRCSATLHIVTDSSAQPIKKQIREILNHYGVVHVTIETESSDEECSEKNCILNQAVSCRHCHHGHHH